MKIIHFCAGLEGWNGMANTARQFVAEERAMGHDSRLTNQIAEIAEGTDVVEIHGAWLPAVHQAAKRAKTINARLIIRPAGSYDPIRLGYHGWKKRMIGPWERAMLRRSDVIQATCAAEAEWIRAYLGRGNKARGKKTMRQGPTIEITDLRRFFNLGAETKQGHRKADEPLHILYLGRRHPLKGVEFLEHAVREINEERKMGNGKGRCVALRTVSGHFGEELERDWAWCDVLCLPTLSENFGRVVAEALERGRRVITTDGAPAWEDLKPPRGIYLRGYRNGDDATRVRLLKEALTRV